MAEEGGGKITTMEHVLRNINLQRTSFLLIVESSHSSVSLCELFLIHCSTVSPSLHMTLFSFL